MPVALYRAMSRVAPLKAIIVLTVMQPQIGDTGGLDFSATKEAEC